MIVQYKPRKSEETPLFEIVETNFESFVKSHQDLPEYVVKEFEAFLKCGIIRYGFARFQCGSCDAFKIVPFSCKKRGFCPSCAGRRMNEGSMRLGENLPDVPYRQWVLTLPIALRYWLAKSNTLLAKIHGLFISEVTKYYLSVARDVHGLKNSKTGSITAIQRFSSNLKLNIHFHSIFVEGVYKEEENGVLSFHKIRPPSDDEIAFVLTNVTNKIVALLRKLGFLKENVDDDSDIDFDKMKKSSAQDLVAFGDNEGLKVARIGKGFGIEGEKPFFRHHFVFC